MGYEILCRGEVKNIDATNHGKLVKLDLKGGAEIFVSRAALISNPIDPAKILFHNIALVIE